jgi:hypothetical protein
LKEFQANSVFSMLFSVLEYAAFNRDIAIGDALSCEIYPGGVGFETRSASGGHGAVLVANLTRPG